MITQTVPAAARINSSGLAGHALQQRAVESMIWGMPVANVDALRQAFARDAQVHYGEIAYWSIPAEMRTQGAKRNASAYYVYFSFNLKDGPVVVDVPRATGAGLFGSIITSWEVPLIGVGPEGEDKGRGGRYVLLPLQYKGWLPPGCIPVHCETHTGYGLFRAIPASTSNTDITSALSLVKKMRVYPLANMRTPSPQRFVDMAGKLFDGVVLQVDERSETFFLAFAAPNHGSGTFYLGGFRDANGQPLRGEKNYQLHVPAKVPAKQYWAVTAYDIDSPSLSRESRRTAIDSYTQKVAKNRDGSLEVYFGPTPPASGQSNWICTTPGSPWFTFLRSYGPEKATFEKSWVLPKP